MQKEYKTSNKEEITFSDKLVEWIPFLNKIFKVFPWLMQFINFGIVGVSNTIVAYGIYAILVYFNLHPQIANIISFLASMLNAYIWNKVWVFKDSSNKKKTTAVKFTVVYGGNLLLGIILLYLYLDVWHLNKYIAPFLSLPITIPANYILNKFWVFKGEN
ncbi:GtrA family protein [Clostridium sp. CTA-7]